LGEPTRVLGVVQAPDGERPDRFSITLIVLGDEESPTRRLRTQFLNNAQGEYQYGPLEAGRYQVEAMANGFQATLSRPFEVVPGQQARVNVQLSRGGRIVGVILDEVSGEPIPGAAVQIGRGNPRTLQATGRRAIADNTGRFVLDGISEQRQTLEVSADGYIQRMVSAITMRTDEERDLAIYLTPLNDDSEDGLDLVGVGISMNRLDDGSMEVVGTVDSGPAVEVGIQNGDRLLVVDGQTTSALTMNEVVEKIRGEEGSVVELTVQRGDGPPRTVQISRRRTTRQWQRGNRPW